MINLVCRDCGEYIDDNTWHHDCQRCHAHFVSNKRLQFYCMNCRPPFLKPVAAKKLNDLMMNKYGYLEQRG